MYRYPQICDMSHTQSLNRMHCHREEREGNDCDLISCFGASGPNGPDLEGFALDAKTAPVVGGCAILVVVV